MVGGGDVLFPLTHCGATCWRVHGRHRLLTGCTRTFLRQKYSFVMLHISGSLSKALQPALRRCCRSTRVETHDSSSYHTGSRARCLTPLQPTPKKKIKPLGSAGRRHGPH